MKNKSSLRSWLPLIGLTFAVFVFNTSEFMPIGLLSDIASDLHITASRAGLLISVYAWMVAIMSLPLMILASRMEMKRLMITVVTVFMLSQLGSAFASGYYTLMASRIGVACAHSVFWSIVSPMAVRTVPENRRAFALSMVATGSSVAMVVGLPLGRVIGISVGWRMTFFIIAVIAALILLYLALVFPRVESRGSFSLGKMPALLRNRVLVGIFIMSVLFATAHYTAYSYIEPFLASVGGMSPATITLTLIIFGASGILGSIAFTRWYTGHRYGFIAITTAVPAITLLLLWPATCSLWAIIAVCVVWGAMATAFNVAFQDNTMKYAPAEATSIAMSIFSGIFNLGIGSGAYIGGFVVAHMSLSLIGVAGGIVGIAATAYCLLRLFPDMRRRERATA